MNLPLYAFLFSFVLSILKDHIDVERFGRRWKVVIWCLLLGSLVFGVAEIVKEQVDVSREQAFRRYLELETVFEQTRAQGRVGDFDIDSETWAVLEEDVSARIAGRMLEGLAREAAAYGNSRVNDCYCVKNCETACGIPSPVGSALPPHVRKELADSVVLHVRRPGGTVIGSSIGAEPNQIQCTRIKDHKVWDEARAIYLELEKALNAYPGWESKEVDAWNQAPRFAVVRAARNLGYFRLCDALSGKADTAESAQSARKWFRKARNKAESLGANVRFTDLRAKIGLASLLAKKAEIITIRDTRYVQVGGLPVEGFGVSEISKQMQARMTGRSWKVNLKCPAFSDLRVLYLRHWTFSGTVKTGHLVVAAEVARSALDVFTQLYQKRVPLAEVSPADFRDGDDSELMKHNVTSAFNCRTKTEKPEELSEHGLGRAIDVNPLQNPYVSGKVVAPPEGAAFVDQHELRFPVHPGVLNRSGAAVEIFREAGWLWGGDWKDKKDWQHFEAPSKVLKEDLEQAKCKAPCAPAARH